MRKVSLVVDSTSDVGAKRCRFSSFPSPPGAADRSLDREIVHEVIAGQFPDLRDLSVARLADHLLVQPQTGELVGVIDFTDAALGDPVQDCVGLSVAFGKPFVQRALEAYEPSVAAGFWERLEFRADLLRLTQLAEAVRRGTDVEKYQRRILDASERRTRSPFPSSDSGGEPRNERTGNDGALHVTRRRIDKKAQTGRSCRPLRWADRVLMLSSCLEDRNCLISLTPGGALEPGESFEEAARRECLEETGLELTGELDGVWEREHTWTWQGRTIEVFETYFFARVDRFEPEPNRLEEYEQEQFRDYRWCQPTICWNATNSSFLAILRICFRPSCEGRFPKPRSRSARDPTVVQTRCHPPRGTLRESLAQCRTARERRPVARS